ncbi:hypothetical protein KCU89_g82, partial [Aureobasidium melanogenum]
MVEQVSASIVTSNPLLAASMLLIAIGLIIDIESPSGLTFRTELQHVFTHFTLGAWLVEEILRCASAAVSDYEVWGLCSICHHKADEAGLSCSFVSRSEMMHGGDHFTSAGLCVNIVFVFSRDRLSNPNQHHIRG